jgi:hypothetical protein
MKIQHGILEGLKEGIFIEQNNTLKKLRAYEDSLNPSAPLPVVRFSV